MYKTNMKQVMTYTTEIRTETGASKKLTRTTEIGKLRYIVEWARQRRRQWRDHANRMSNLRLAKMASTEKLNTSKPQGRPPKR